MAFEQSQRMIKYLIFGIVSHFVGSQECRVIAYLTKFLIDLALHCIAISAQPVLHQHLFNSLPIPYEQPDTFNQDNIHSPSLYPTISQ